MSYFTTIDEAVQRIVDEVKRTGDGNYVQVASRLWSQFHLSEDDVEYLACSALASRVNPGSFSVTGPGLPPVLSGPSFRLPHEFAQPPISTPKISKVPAVILEVLGQRFTIGKDSVEVRNFGAHELSFVISSEEAKAAGLTKRAEAFKYVKDRLRATGKRFIRELSEAEQLRFAERFKKGTEVYEKAF